MTPEVQSRARIAGKMMSPSATHVAVSRRCFARFFDNEEKRVDGNGYFGGIIDAEQFLCGKIGVPLVDDAVRKVRHVWSIVGAKDSIKIVTNSHQMNIVTKIGAIIWVRDRC